VLVCGCVGAVGWWVVAVASEVVFALVLACGRVSGAGVILVCGVQWVCSAAGVVAWVVVLLSWWCSYGFAPGADRLGGLLGCGVAMLLGLGFARRVLKSVGCFGGYCVAGVGLGVFVLLGVGVL